MGENNALKGGIGGNPHPYLSLEELENSCFLSSGLGGLGKGREV